MSIYEHDNEILGWNVKFLRKRKQLNRHDFAKIVRMDYAMLCDLEKGTSRCIPVDAMETICQWYKIPLEVLKNVNLRKGDTPIPRTPRYTLRDVEILRRYEARIAFLEAAGDTDCIIMPM